jgi:DNA-binding transcriptional MocR family regulator
VVVVAEFTQGLAPVARAPRRLGARCVATEDPGFGLYRNQLGAAGLRTVRLRVGDGGAAPGDLTGEVALVMLTAAHQYPRGVVLARDRRMAFVALARRQDAYIVEDDYDDDGEFRYDQQPVGAMQALAPDRVVFAGTVSKSLGPGMRLGWLVVPPALHGPLLDAIEQAGVAVPVIDQLAFADQISRGDYDRHIRRARMAYRRRRKELTQWLAAVTSTPLAWVAAGLHALLPVGSAAHERRLVTTGRHAGVQMHGLHTDGYWHAPNRGQPAALILGYAAPPPHAWPQSLDLLTELIADHGAAGAEAKTPPARTGSAVPSRAACGRGGCPRRGPRALELQ